MTFSVAELFGNTWWTVGNDSLPTDGVAFRHQPARGSRFTTLPPGGTSCFTTHRRRSGRRARPNFGRRRRLLYGVVKQFHNFRFSELVKQFHKLHPHTAIRGPALPGRPCPRRTAYRPALYVDGGESWAGVDQRREVSVFDNLFIRLVLPFPLDQHFFNLFSLFLRKMFNLIRLQFSRCIALLVFGHFCQIRND